MCITQPICKHLQGDADARRRARRRTFGLQVADNKADAVTCECLRRAERSFDNHINKKVSSVQQIGYPKRHLTSL